MQVFNSMFSQSPPCPATAALDPLDFFITMGLMNTLDDHKDKMQEGAYMALANEMQRLYLLEQQELDLATKRNSRMANLAEMNHELSTFNLSLQKQVFDLQNQLDFFQRKHRASRKTPLEAQLRMRAVFKELKDRYKESRCDRVCLRCGFAQLKKRTNVIEPCVVLDLDPWTVHD